MAVPIVAICEQFDAVELRRMAGVLRRWHLPAKAAAQLRSERRAKASQLLRAALRSLREAGTEPVLALAEVMDAFATQKERRGVIPQVVWSGAQVEHEEAATSGMAVRLIDSAVNEILATTYSATPSSRTVQALKGAARRGVKVTILADEAQLREIALALRREIPAASVLVYRYRVGDYAGRQHAKLLVIDRHRLLLTSANLSSAALRSNLEAGVIFDDAQTAQHILEHLRSLRVSGVLVPLDEAGASEKSKNVPRSNELSR
jgi:phosphatidylserine/phosphatidylglycerophosphate/cardiolipin synthase-like enzyme